MASRSEDPGSFSLLMRDGAAATVEPSGTIYGSIRGTQQITVRDAPGILLFDGSFNAGGDRIFLTGVASAWTVHRLGAVVVFNDGDTVVSVPAGLGKTDVFFGDGVRGIEYEALTSTISLGSQEITSTPAIIAAPHTDVSANGVTEAQSCSSMLVREGAMAAALGWVSIYGTRQGSETISVRQDAHVWLDGSFNAGGDVIDLPGPSSQWFARTEGAYVLLDSLNGSVLMPAVPNGSTIHFIDRDYTLIVDAASESIMIGNTRVTSSLTYFYNSAEQSVSEHAHVSDDLLGLASSWPVVL